EYVTGSDITFPVGNPQSKRMSYPTDLHLFTPPTKATVLTFLQKCNSLPAGTAAADFERGLLWQCSYPAYANIQCYNHVQVPNGQTCDNYAGFRTIGVDVAGGAQAPSSWHSGQGVNVAFCDGAVRFIRNTVNLDTWWALGTMAGGEAISADSY